MLSGIDKSMASNSTFLLTVRKTVAEVLNISETKISIPILSTGKRVLLTGALVLYNFNITSARTPESYRLTLTESVSTGGFDTILRMNSGVQVLSTSGFTLEDFSPTSKPSMSPAYVFSNEVGKIEYPIN